MAVAPLPTRSSSFPIVVAMAFFIAGLVFFRDYYEVAMEHLSTGVYTSEQVFGLVGAALLVLACIGTLVAFPEQLRVEADGLRSVRGVFGRVQRLRPKASVQSLTVHSHGVTSGSYRVTVHDVWIDGSGGRKRLRRFPPAEGAEAKALAAHCAELWGAKVEPYH